jgi:hypothetical protein
MKSAKTRRSIAREVQNLEVRYGEIGISAVAAAMRFQGDGKTPGEAAREPKPHQRHDRWLEDAVPEFAA